jgi:hypothetical protein
MRTKRTGISPIFLIAAVIFLSAFTLIGQQITRRNLRVVQLPDLVVSVRAPQRLLATDDISQKIRIQVGNVGNFAAGPFHVEIKIDPYGRSLRPVETKALSAIKAVPARGGLIPVKGMEPGQKLNLLPNPAFSLPHQLPPGQYTLRVEVDSQKKVKERSEDNNLGSVIFFIGPRITNVVQNFSWMIAPLCEIDIDGTGFGSAQGAKILKMGTYTLEVEPGGTWQNDEIYCHYPIAAPHGEHYMVHILEGGQVISNEFDFFLKMILFKTNFQPYEAPAGTSLHVDGMMMGASKGQKKLMFGGTEAQVQSWNDASIQCTVPILSPGTYNVYIWRNGVTISNVVSYTITSGPDK